MVIRPMKSPGTAALIALIIAMLLILGVGAYRASVHREAIPNATPARATSAPPNQCKHRAACLISLNRWWPYGMS